MTGLLLALSLPASTPYWVPVMGAAFGIIVVKQFYGGLGRNFMNPALAGRMLAGTLPMLMTLAAIFARSSGELTVLAGVGLVIGSFVSGGTATPNFVRFAKNNAAAVSTTVTAFFLGNSLMFAFGAVGGAFTGKDDIFYVMIAQGLAIPALIVLGANIWTTNNNALYTGGLGLTNITGLRQKPMVLVSGAVGTVAAIWLYNNFVGWLNFLNATLPPVGAIVMLDYFIHRTAYRAGEEPKHSVHWGSIAGVVLGALVGNFVPAGIASINAMVAAGACYLLADKLVYGKK